MVTVPEHACGQGFNSKPSTHAWPRLASLKSIRQPVCALVHKRLMLIRVWCNCDLGKMVGGEALMLPGQLKATVRVSDSCSSRLHAHDSPDQQSMLTNYSYCVLLVDTWARTAPAHQTLPAMGHAA
jgi:hypothetical protein